MTVPGEPDYALVIGMCYQGDMVGMAPESARLIAAAPMMLQALQALTARLRGEYGSRALVAWGPLLLDAEQDALKIADVAIAAATEEA